MTAGASAVLIAIGSGSVAVATLVADEPRIVTTTGQDAAAESGADRSDAGDDGAGAAPAPPRDPAGAALPPAEAGLGELIDPVHPVGERVDRRTHDDPADRTGTRPPRPTVTVATTVTPAPAAPVPARREPTMTTATVVETREIPYRTRLIRDSDLPRGRKRVQSEGVPGEETVRWLVTYADGQPTERRLVDTTVTTEPQDRVVAFGTRRSKGEPECRPDSDHCFPIGRSVCPDADLPTEDAAREIRLVCE